MRNGMRLLPGYTIGLVAIARWVNPEIIEDACRMISEWGYQVVLGDTVHKKHNQFGGTDAERAADLQAMLDNPNIKGIVILRGGYGIIRLIDHLDFTAFTKHPKWIIGFSDVTILHAHVNDKLGLPTLHAPMPYSWMHNTPEALLSLQHALSGTPKPLQAPAHALNIRGDVSAPLIGGNLSILYSLLGTRYGFSTAGKILVIEDLDEYVYHIDRMMMSLQLAGKLDHIAGLVVGGMTDMKDHATPFGEDAETIIHRLTARLNIPVAFGMPFGHIDDNQTLLLGNMARLEVTATGSVLTAL